MKIILTSVLQGLGQLTMLFTYDVILSQEVRFGYFLVKKGKYIDMFYEFKLLKGSTASYYCR